MLSELNLFVIVLSVLAGFTAYRTSKHVERTERDPKYRRRWLYIPAGMYTLAAFATVIDMANGSIPAWMMFGLAIPAGIA